MQSLEFHKEIKEMEKAVAACATIDLCRVLSWTRVTGVANKCLYGCDSFDHDQNKLT